MEQEKQEKGTSVKDVIIVIYCINNQIIFFCFKYSYFASIFYERKEYHPD